MSVQNNIESNGVSPRTVPDTSSGNIITASDSEQNHRQIPLHWIFAFDSENSPVLPFNVRRSGSLFSVFSDGHEYVFSSFEEATRHAETNFKACPLSGRPVPTGPQNIGQLCRYLKNSYPEVFKDLSSHGKINKLYVFDDGYYLNNRALHPEMVCKNGIKCHGINGGCSFNHDGMPWCIYDKNPSSRCRSSKCKYNHGRGRVKHDNEKRSTPAPSRVSTPSAPKKESKEDVPTEDLSSVTVKLENTFEKAESNATLSKEWTTVSSKKVSKKSKTAKPKTVKPNISKEDQFPALSSETTTIPTLSWKEKCDLQKEKDEEKRLFEEAEKQRLVEEAEKQKLVEEAEKQRLVEEAEKQKLEEKAQKQKELEAQFEGMTSYSKVVKNEPVVHSKKSSKKSRKIKKQKSDEENELLRQLYSKN